MSPVAVEQDKIDFEYFFYKRAIMQLFSKGAEYLFLFLPMKVTLRLKFIFHYCQPVQNQPKFHILFHKNGSQRDFYIMTLFLVLFKGFKLAVFGLPTHSPLFANALKMWLTNFLCALS